MRTVYCKIGDLADLIIKDMERLELEVKKGILETAAESARIILPDIPVAFGPLRESLHVDAIEFMHGHVSVVIDAPHAAAVEIGSRPHIPPLEPLVKWVKLRGMQALRKGGDRKKLLGKTSAYHANQIGGHIAAGKRFTSKDTAFIGRVSRAASKRVTNRGGDEYEAADAASIRGEKARASRGFTPIDVPRQIAIAIQASIAAHGTEPHWYVGRNMGKIERALHRRMREAVKDP